MRTFTRLEMYEFAWSEPMQSLAKKFSLSDRGLAKICAAANVPVPARGYWAKLQAVKKLERWPLPPRALGQRETIWLGRSAWGQDRESDADILNSPIPPAPVFTPDMDDVRAQAAALVRKAPLPLGDIHGWHSQIAKCLSADVERARKQKESSFSLSWNEPIFASPFEKRRLRILNALFTCLTRVGIPSRRTTRPLWEWTDHIGQRRGGRVAIVALARRVVGILYAMWRDGTPYDVAKLARPRTLARTA
jgi:hypothetical protein